METLVYFIKYDIEQNDGGFIKTRKHSIVKEMTVKELIAFCDKQSTGRIIQKVKVLK